MTPKEKAIELVDKFALGGWGKENALRCVDEIINVTVGLNGWIDGFQYWEEVKHKIENYG
jgi:hypothetical protein